jgi:hypothetical protein
MDYSRLSLLGGLSAMLILFIWSYFLQYNSY